MRLAAALSVYIGSIVVANHLTTHYGLVNIGFGLVVTAGTFAAGFALFARDFVHRYGGVKVVLAAIGAGTLLSWWLASPQIALASGIAFMGAELVDLAVYARVHASVGFIPAIASSNIVAVPVDTLLFLQIAGFGITWQAVTGQVIAKLVYATAVPLAIYACYAVLRNPVRA